MSSDGRDGAGKLVLKLKKNMWNNVIQDPPISSQSPSAAVFNIPITVMESVSYVNSASSHATNVAAVASLDSDRLGKRNPISVNGFSPSSCAKCGTGIQCNACRRKSLSAAIVSKPAKPPIILATSNVKKRKSQELPKKSVMEFVNPKSKSVKTATPLGNIRQIYPDFTNSKLLFEFVDNFLQNCPAQDCESKVSLNSGESQMSAVGNLTYNQLAQHLLALRIEHIQRLIRPLLNRLMQHPKNMEVFNKPVDPVALGIPNYLLVVKSPMDLGTIKSRLQRGDYRDMEDIVADITLVFENAVLFNPAQHIVHIVAKLLQHEFQEEMKTLREKLQKEVCININVLHSLS